MAQKPGQALLQSLRFRVIWARPGDISNRFLQPPRTRGNAAVRAAEGYAVVDVEAPLALRALGAEKALAVDTQLLFMMSRS